MTLGEVRWVQGAVVILLDNPVDMKQLVHDTDYVLLQMMGKIAHHCPLLPAVPKQLPGNKPNWPNEKGWPFKH